MDFDLCMIQYLIILFVDSSWRQNCSNSVPSPFYIAFATYLGSTNHLLYENNILDLFVTVLTDF
jgi:hypothetical protein